jgi:serine/threonine protein kinase
VHSRLPRARLRAPGHQARELPPQDWHSKPLALTDFGLSKDYLDRETRQPLPEVERSHFHGTPKYASLTAHRFRDQGPKDDLISWAYSLVELVDGRLPWGLERDAAVVHMKKTGIPERTLFRSLPHEFLEVANYLNSLTYASAVNYPYILSVICKAWDQVGRGIGKAGGAVAFDWEGLSRRTVEGITALAALPRGADYPERMKVKELAADEEDSSANKCDICGVV